MDKKIIVASLAMDLKRVALGLYRGSSSAAIFKKEALQRGHELEQFIPDPNIQKLWRKTKQVLQSDSERVAEDALMYSTLFQNFAVKNFN